MMVTQFDGSCVKGRLVHNSPFPRNIIPRLSTSTAIGRYIHTITQQHSYYFCFSSSPLWDTWCTSPYSRNFIKVLLTSTRPRSPFKLPFTPFFLKKQYYCLDLSSLERVNVKSVWSRLLLVSLSYTWENIFEPHDNSWRGYCWLKGRRKSNLSITAFLSAVLQLKSRSERVGWRFDMPSGARSRAFNIGMQFSSAEHSWRNRMRYVGIRVYSGLVEKWRRMSRNISQLNVRI